MRRALAIGLAASLMVGVVALPAAAGTGSKNITEVVVSTDGFDVLTNLVVEAGLADDLAAVDGVTVFAPTSWAFRVLVKNVLIGQGMSARDAKDFAFKSDDTVISDAIIDMVGIAGVTDILLYHVYGGGEVPASVAVTLDNAPITMLNGGTLVVDGNGSGVRLKTTGPGSARVKVADVMASNGIIHVINRVLLP